MPPRSDIPRLTDILAAIERVRGILGDLPLEAFEATGAPWLVERGVEIISEASRRLSDDLKARHPEIPWPKVAGIGNVLRHDYESISAPVLWALVHNHSAHSGKGMPRRGGSDALVEWVLLAANRNDSDAIDVPRLAQQSMTVCPASCCVKGVTGWPRRIRLGARSDWHLVPFAGHATRSDLRLAGFA